jgi:uncharacterized protein (DUF1786 family)
MRILSLDIGTGTQDIVLFDSEREPENCFKLIMPAPTQIVAARVREITAQRRGVALTGKLMGGGPVGWAVKDHLKAGLRAWAEPAAGRTFNDDLNEVRAMGVEILAEGESAPPDAVVLELKDLDLEAVGAALAAFGLEARYDGLAVGVLDHGEAPPGFSDRVFRFQHVERVVAAACATKTPKPEDGLLAFAYTPGDLPGYLTRLAAVTRGVPEGIPVALMDTGAAAGLGSLQDRTVRRHRNLVLVNVGNMHTLATHIVNGRLSGIMEHHTGRLTPERLADLVERLAKGTLSGREVLDDRGHGCYTTSGGGAASRPFVAVTGPRRGLLAAGLRGGAFAPGSPYYAVPHGDMMTAGCWGLIRAYAHRYPAMSDSILAALAR